VLEGLVSHHKKRTRDCGSELRHDLRLATS
jgi:hypothetical protein